MKKTTKPAGKSSRSPRVKCACASCQCTVDVTRAVRRGNLTYCGEACAARACTLEACQCEHDHCSA